MGPREPGATRRAPPTGYEGGTVCSTVGQADRVQLADRESGTGRFGTVRKYLPANRFSRRRRRRSRLRQVETEQRVLEMQQRYASLSDDELLFIAVTTNLTNTASEAMVREFDDRNLDVDIGKYADELTEEWLEIEKYEARRGRLLLVASIVLTVVIPMLVLLFFE